MLQLSQVELMLEFEEDIRKLNLWNSGLAHDRLLPA